MKDKIVIIGDGEIAEIAYDYFMTDSGYQVCAFAVEKDFRKKETLFERPVIDLEDLSTAYPKEYYNVFVAISFTCLNTVRTRIFKKVKNLGYQCVSYVSSKSYCNSNVEIGENVFVFENATIQRGAKIGDNTFVWSRAIVSHKSMVGSNCWIALGCAISGFSKIKNNCFLGANSTIVDYVVVEKDTLIGAGAVCVKDIMEKGKIYVGNPARKLNKSAYEYFNVNNVMEC